MSNIPILLVYSRLLTGFLMLGFSVFFPDTIPSIYIGLLTYGLLSDIFDGIIARRLNVSTQKMRRLDSSVDQAFWFCVIACTYHLYPEFYKEYYIQICILIGFEALTYLVSFIRFRKEVATHAISSKFWVLTIFATLVELFSIGYSHTLFLVCFYVGVITRIEILLILFIIREWTNDIPSIYHAIQLRKGKKIKRNKMFNG